MDPVVDDEERQLAIDFVEDSQSCSLWIDGWGLRF